MSIPGVYLNPDTADTGGVPVATDGQPPGSLVSEAGQLQFGPMLMGVGTRAGWRDLVGWRSLSPADTSDVQRPQAAGAYPGAVFGQSLVVTFTYLVTGSIEAKAAALAAIEAHTVMDGVERPLVVNDDGTGAWVRMARVIARDVPQEKHYRHGPAECSVQFLCADPRRYSLQPALTVVRLGVSDGGLAYDAGLAYDTGLDYGTYSNEGGQVTNQGSVPTPARLQFRGPLTNPVLSAGWVQQYMITLADGETLDVDADSGTVLLNGATDRLNTISPRSDPPEACLIAPGTTDLTLTAAAGTGSVAVAFNHARH